jgi:transcription-repair coupling factor (superfamily II helicase)
VDTGPKGAVIGFHLNTFHAPEKLLAYIGKHPTTLKLRPDQKLVFTCEWKDDAQKVTRVAAVLGDIAGL